MSSTSSYSSFFLLEVAIKIINAIKNSTPLNEVKAEDCISRAEAVRVASGYCHPANIAKELAKLPSKCMWDNRYECEAEDCISRKEAIKGLGEQPLQWLGSDMEFQEIADWKNTKAMLEKLPSVYPKSDKPSGKWIPISKRFPDISTEVLLCDRGKCYVVSLEFEEYSEDGGGYYWEDSHGDFFECEDDQAWQPLPKPYVVEEQGEST